jgi:hypothetical protein
MTLISEPGGQMVKDDDVEGEPEIIVAEPVEEPTLDVADEGSGAALGRRVLDVPTGLLRRVKHRYRGLTQKDKFIVLIGLLIIVLAIAVMAIYYTGEGIVHDLDEGPRFVDDWKTKNLQPTPIVGQEENTNLEGQNTPYLVNLEPGIKEVFFITNLTAHVRWVDESSPPAQVPAIGYNTNEPDGFQLIIRLQDEMGEWQSDLVFNAEGQEGTIDLDVDLVNELGAPIAVANPAGAEYLPKGYLPTLRVDFIVFTEECGDWPPPDPLRPTIGDGGNHYQFEWSVTYLFDGDGKP